MSQFRLKFGFTKIQTKSKERSLPVRLRNSEIHDRINGNLEIEFTDQRLTSFSGLELFNRYFRAIRLRGTIKGAFLRSGMGGDYKVPELVLTFVALWLAGGNRLRHIRYLSSDWLVKRTSSNHLSITHKFP